MPANRDCMTGLISGESIHIFQTEVNNYLDIGSRTQDLGFGEVMGTRDFVGNMLIQQYVTRCLERASVMTS